MHPHPRRRPGRGQFQSKELPWPCALLFVSVRYAPYFTAIGIADYGAVWGTAPVISPRHVLAHSDAGGRGGPECIAGTRCASRRAHFGGWDAGPGWC